MTLAEYLQKEYDKAWEEEKDDLVHTSIKLFDPEIKWNGGLSGFWERFRKIMD